ncbi:MAG TPA: hypothetical protein DIW47_07910 [Bacteroidetes bacterium]|nr:hypothetical protein [Bacteroidota bacterium]
MKKTLFVLLTLALVGVGSWYFIQKAGSSTRLSKYVPEESDVVINVNFVALFKKADLAHAEKRASIQALVQKHGDTAIQYMLGELFKDPGSSGIRFTEQAYFFFRNVYDPQKNNAGLLLGLKNPADFEAMIRKIEPDLKVQKDEDLSYWEMPAGTVLVWNSKTALVYKGRNISENLVNAREILSGDMPGIHQKKLFKDAWIKEQDIHVYLDYTKLLAGKPGITDKLDLKGGVAFASGISFMDGEVRMENKVAFENSKDAWLMDLYRHKAKGHTLNYTVNEAPLAAMQLQINTDKLFDILMENETARGALEEMAKGLELKPEEVLDMFSGTVSLGFSGFETRVVKRNIFGMEQESEASLPKGAFFIGIKNHEHFNKLLDKAGLKSETGKYVIDDPFLGPYYLVKTDAGLSVMIHEPMADQLARDKSFGTPDYGEAGTYLKNNANSGYVNLDLQTMPPSFTAILKDEFPRYSLIETSLKPLHHVEFRQDKKRGFSKVVFKNKEQNSLIELLDLTDAIYLKYMELELEEEEEVQIEELILNPEGIELE